MRYSIVTCPRCGKNRTVDSNTETAGCPSCGKRFQLSKSVKHFETDSLESARSALAVLNSGDAKILEAEKPSKVSSDVDELRKIPDALERAAAVARLLTSRKGDFSEDDFNALAKDAGLKNPAKALESALDAGQVYEPRPGRYRAS